MLRIERKKISELTGLPLNPRKSSKSLERAIKESIHRFGLVSPLIWNEKTGHLIGGHQRLKVLKNEGEEEVEVVVLSLSPEEERALNLALNKIGGEWEYESLSEVIGELSPEMRVLTGFSLEEIEALLSQVEPREKEEFRLPEKDFYVKVFIPFEKAERFRILAKENGWNWREL